MQILIAAATSFEIAPFVSSWNNGGNDDQLPAVSFLVTGVGQVAATYALTNSIHQRRPDLIIQAGIAGVFGNAFPVGSTVLVKQDAFGDLGLETAQQFRTLFDAGFVQPDELPYTNGWLVNRHPLLEKGLLPIATGITVNKVSDSQLQYQQLIQHFSPQVESMEGAALHYVALLQEIPFVQVRAISNFVGDRDKGNWKIKEAIEALNADLHRLLNWVSSSSAKNIHP